ncbi:MAG TPA: hypothetical protein VGM18_04490 [Candidatus Sulfotelmatobacter sp.]|jgi:hypothetical protein
MNTIRKFAYAALLAATTVNFAPTPASAQEPAHGKFTLSHEVHWGTATLPAGDYEFSFDTNGISPVLNLSKISGSRTGFMMLVPITEDTKSTDLSRLLLEATPEGSYVSAMQLPEFGMTLRFPVPSRAMEKPIANAGTVAAATGQ